MAHKFERCRMEPLKDGTVNIGLTIVATIGQTDEADPDFGASAQWRICSAAHVHGWDTCDIRALFMARQKDAQDVDIAGTSAKDQLVAWLDGQRSEKALNIPKEIALPTRKVTKGGKQVDEPIKDVSLT